LVSRLPKTFPVAYDLILKTAITNIINVLLKILIISPPWPFDPTTMIVSRVASESIRNMNKTEDSNKNRNEICKDDETTPKYVGYVENILQEMKTTEKKRISKVDEKQTRLRRVKSESGT
jgi:hypothetical protein